MRIRTFCDRHKLSCPSRDTTIFPKWRNWSELRGQQPIEQEHIDNNTAVRDMLVGRGIYPEQLPPAEDVKKVERRLAKDDQKAKIEKKKKNK